MNTMSHSLRIKEDSYSKMFAEKEIIAKESKSHLERIKVLEQKLASQVHDDKAKNLEADNIFLREKLKV